MAESPALSMAESVTVKIRPFAEALLAIDGKRHAVCVNDTFARLVVVVIGRVSHYGWNQSLLRHPNLPGWCQFCCR